MIHTQLVSGSPIVQPQLNIADLALMLRTTEAANRIRLYRNSSTLPPFYRVGRLFRWNPAAVQAWIERQTESPCGTIASAKSVEESRQPIRHRRSRRMRELERL